jgi:hypothetical protein
MLPENEIAVWWDAMSAAERVEKAKELAVWTTDAYWVVAWQELSAANRQQLSAALAALVPQHPTSRSR